MLVFAALALVLCFACYYLGVHGKTRREHLLALPPLLLICFGIFVCASFHWFIYLLPALLLMGLKLERRSDFYLLWLGMSLGLTVYFASAESMTAQPLQVFSSVARGRELSSSTRASIRSMSLPVGKRCSMSVCF